MLSVSKPQVVDWIEFAMYVKGVRIGEDIGIAVARLTCCNDAGACFNGLTYVSAAFRQRRGKELPLHHTPRPL